MPFHESEGNVFGQLLGDSFDRLRFARAFERAPVNALQLAHTKDKTFACACCPVEHLSLGDGGLPTFDALQVLDGAAMINAARAIHKRCGSWPETEPGIAAPIGLIVSTLATRLGKVRHFVMVQSVLSERFDTIQVHLQFDVFGDCYQLTLLQLPPKASPFS